MPCADWHAIGSDIMSDMLPGCYPNLPAEEYHTGPGISKSLLDAFQISPWYFEQAKLGKGKTSSGFDMGTAAHYAVLQPELFDKYVVCGPEDRRGKKWKDLVADNPGKTILTAGEYQEIMQVRDAVLNHPTASSLMTAGEPELSYYWIDPGTGLLCRCRPDRTINPMFGDDSGELVDFKLVARENAETSRFLKYIINYDYYVQAAFYLDGVSEVERAPFKGFTFVVCEKETYQIRAFHFPSDHFLVEAGRIKYTHYLFKLAEYLNNPPEYIGYPLEIEQPEAPAWFVRQVQNGDFEWASSCLNLPNGDGHLE